MTPQQLLLTAFIVVNIVLVVAIRLRPQIRTATGGKAVIFLALFVLPAIVFAGSTAHHLERATSTEFCLSCHVMEPYGRSLNIDSVEHLPAVHVQNRLVPPDHACYSCHASYTMFGDLRAKLRGIRHVSVNYVGIIPDRLSLYEPFPNADCLGCHASARNFEENMFHGGIRAELEADETSCLACHTATHAIDDLDGLPAWNPDGPTVEVP